MPKGLLVGKRYFSGVLYLTNYASVTVPESGLPEGVVTGLHVPLGGGTGAGAGKGVGKGTGSGTGAGAGPGIIWPPMYWSPVHDPMFTLMSSTIMYACLPAAIKNIFGVLCWQKKKIFHRVGNENSHGVPRTRRLPHLPASGRARVEMCSLEMRG